MILRELFEASTKSVGIIFGRFNPPHQGHRAAWEMASENSVWYVGTNKSTQGPKDPLPFDIKVKAMQAVYPEIKGHIVAETSWLTLASKVYEKHGNIVLNIYTDEDWVTKALVQYNGKEGAHGYYEFGTIQQQPTPRLSSATALRAAVAADDRDAFGQAAGVDPNTLVAGHPFFDVVKHYLMPHAEKVAKKKVKEPVVELSNELLGRYKKAAGADAKKADAEGNYDRGNKRFSGIVKATKKQFANDEKDVAEGWPMGLARDSAKPETLAKRAAWQKTPLTSNKIVIDGYTINFTPDALIISKDGKVLWKKEGDYSQPTNSTLAGAKKLVTGLSRQGQPDEKQMFGKVNADELKSRKEHRKKWQQASNLSYEKKISFQQAWSELFGDDEESGVRENAWDRLQREKAMEAAGVGTITKQNSTVDVNKNTPKKNLKAFRLI